MAMSGTFGSIVMNMVDSALVARLDEAASRYGEIERLAANPDQADRVSSDVFSPGVSLTKSNISFANSG